MLIAMAPEVLVGLAAVGVLFLPALRGEQPGKLRALVAAGALAAAGTMVLLLPTATPPGLSLMFSTDILAKLVRATVAFVAAGVAIMTIDWKELSPGSTGEVASLVLFSAGGAMLMSASTDFLMFFVALQLSSIPLYVLAAGRRGDPVSGEAAFKFLLLGMIASVVMLYGFSLRFGQTYGTSLLSVVRTSSAEVQVTVSLALALVLLGMLFKLGSAPLHFWIPDTYQGSPTPVGALLATVPKCASAAVFVRAIAYGLGLGASIWTSWLMAALSVVSMTVGNMSALAQDNLKRILAYSSVAHIGYLMIALAVGPAGSGAAIFYVVTYALTNLGAFAVVQAVGGSGSDLRVSDLAGLSRRSPVLATVLGVMVLSMLGVPPTPGFWAKLLVFLAAVRAGAWWLAVIGIVNSLVSLGYYIPILRESFKAPDMGALRETGAPLEMGVQPETAVLPVALKWSGAVAVISLAAVIAIGVSPGWLIETAKSAAAGLVGK